MQFTVGIGLLGCGTVGASVAEHLVRDRAAIEARSGIRYELRAIAIRDRNKSRPASIGASLFTTDLRAVVEDPGIDLVIELIGGTSDAAAALELALDRGRHVVTANKDLLATQGPRLNAIAAARRASLRFEGAVAGAIPIARVLEESLAGDWVECVAGIVNGTSTFVLSAMENGASYGQAVEDAQRQGYAEANPTNDVDGIDAAHKCALMAQLAFGVPMVSAPILRTGIAGVSRRDVARARMLGLRLRSIAAVVRREGRIYAEVAPVLLPEQHEFARSCGVENVVRVDARAAGTLWLRGSGAGGAATASAVLGDVVTCLRALAVRGEPISRAPTAGASSCVSPLFAALPRISELPHYPLWDDSILQAPAPQLAAAISWPGKDVLS